MEETTQAAITVADIFKSAGETMTGFVDMSTNFFTSLWANPMGQIAITLGLVSAAIGLCCRLFLRRRHV